MGYSRDFRVRTPVSRFLSDFFVVFWLKISKIFEKKNQKNNSERNNSKNLNFLKKQ